MRPYPVVHYHSLNIFNVKKYFVDSAKPRKSFLMKICIIPINLFKQTFLYYVR